MKTFKTLLKDFLRSLQSDSLAKEDTTVSQSETQFNNPNNTNHETETDETPGDPELDNPSVGEDPGYDEEPQGGTSHHPGGEPSAGGLDREALKAALKAAYDEGVIAGRNAQILERHFPNEDDGIPDFRGFTPKPEPYGNIFSIAKEA